MEYAYNLFYNRLVNNIIWAISEYVKIFIIWHDFFVQAALDGHKKLNTN